MLKITVPYADRGELTEIIRRTTVPGEATIRPVLDAADVLAARQLARRIVVAPTVQDYAIRLVLATHPGGEFEIAEFRNYIQVGASPRAAQALVTTAKVFALMDGRFAASFADVRRVALPALRHRIIRTFEAEADGVDTDELVRGVLDGTPADADHPDDGAPRGAILSEVRR